MTLPDPSHEPTAAPGAGASVGSAPDPAKPSSRRPAGLIFIFITVALDMLAVGMIVPVLPKLIERLVDGNTAAAARIFGLFGTAWAVMQFVFMPILGALSDRFGRRPVVLLSNFGLGLHYLMMALAPSLPWMFAARMISGMASASISTAGAYIADIMPPARRAEGFGLLNAAFGIGFILGPALGGLLGSYGPRVPLWVAAGLSVGNGLYGLLILPESLPRDRRAPFSLRRANPVGALGLLRSTPALTRFAAIQFLSNLAQGVLPSIVVLYTGYRFGWSQRDVGLMLASVGLSTIVVQGGLIRLVIRRFGERVILVAGVLFGVAAFTLFGLAPVGRLFLAGIPIMALWGLAGASAQAMMTRQVSPSEQGRLQGAMSSVQSIAGMLSPTIFTFTFSQFIGPWRDLGLSGAPFLLSALLLAVTVALALGVTARR